MCADDLVLISLSASGLHNALNHLHDYCSKWKLNVNITKSKVIILTKVVVFYINTHSDMVIMIFNYVVSTAI